MSAVAVYSRGPALLVRSAIEPCGSRAKEQGRCMDHMIRCPACKEPITQKQLFWTGTLLRFKCPHCATRIQPAKNTFAITWMVMAVALGLLTGMGAAMLPVFATDAVLRALGYAGLAVLVAGGIALIKWRASLALIRKGQLRVAA